MVFWLLLRNLIKLNYQNAFGFLSGLYKGLELRTYF